MDSAHKDLAELMYIISHDFRAPIRSLHSLSDWIYEDNKDKLSTEGVEQLELMKAQTKKLNSMLDGLLRFSRTIQRKMEPINTELHQIIESAAKNCALDETKIKILSELPLVHCDSYLMIVLFTELFKNAIAAYPTQDKSNIVIIDCKKKQNIWHISVQDQGQGLPIYLKEHLFKPFQIGTEQHNVNSIGIGLTLAKKIIERHNGTIELVANLPKGTIVNLTLPAEILQTDKLIQNKEAK